MLAIVFTHFDQVKGDNLPNETAKRNHVHASLDNAVNAIDEAIGSGAGQSLCRHLESKVYFLGGIDEEISAYKRSTRRQFV
jgi:hypothetical protein